MSSNNRQAVLLHLGPASNFDRSSFPLSKVDGPLEEGAIFLEATLDEIIVIREMIEGRQGYEKFFKDAKDNYDQLVKRKIKLEKRKKSLKRWQLLELLIQNRQTLLFLQAGKELYWATRTTSEMIRRGMVPTSTVDTIPATEDVPANQNIDGMTIQLDNRPDDEMATLTSSTSSCTDPDPEGNGSDDESILEKSMSWESLAMSSMSLLSANVGSVSQASVATSAMSWVPVDASAGTSAGSSDSPRSSESPNIFIGRLTYIKNLYQSNSSLSDVKITDNQPSEKITINVGGSGNR
ncbi:hypothetical protein V8B97DRAFT_2003465 [Scleroderma yunnanense]